MLPTYEYGLPSVIFLLRKAVLWLPCISATQEETSAGAGRAFQTWLRDDIFPVLVLAVRSPLNHVDPLPLRISWEDKLRWREASGGKHAFPMWIHLVEGGVPVKGRGG